jgi:predicted metal-dependent peptidase
VEPEQLAAANAARALKLVAATLPPLSGLTLVNPKVFSAAPLTDLVFGVAHELLHLALDSFGRTSNADPYLVGVAHDYVVNDILSVERHRDPPLCGLLRHGARRESPEARGGELAQNGRGGPHGRWSIAGMKRKRAMRPGSRTRPCKPSGGAARTLMAAAATAYQPPWQLALRHWLDAVALGPRSYARASRRGADRDDGVSLAGRKREGWALHVVVDTSGSMVDTLPHVLGRLAAFAEGAGVNRIHVLQCDVGVTADEWLDPADRASDPVTGFGGSDMSPAMDRLAAAPEVNAALVLTDGCISYPAAEPPYAVLWGWWTARPTSDRRTAPASTSERSDPVISIAPIQAHINYCIDCSDRADPGDDSRGAAAERRQCGREHRDGERHQFHEPAVAEPVAEVPRPPVPVQHGVGRERQGEPERGPARPPGGQRREECDAQHRVRAEQAELLPAQHVQHVRFVPVEPFARVGVEREPAEHLVVDGQRDDQPDEYARRRRTERPQHEVWRARAPAARRARQHPAPDQHDVGGAHEQQQRHE